MKMIHLFFFTLLFATVNSWLNFPSRRNSFIISRKVGEDDQNLIEKLKNTFGETEDIFAGAESLLRQAEKPTSPSLMQGLKGRDTSTQVNNQLLQWLESNNVWVKTKSEWGKAPHPLVIASNTEDDGESCGRGLLARESIGEGELLVTIPIDLCLTRSTAQSILGKGVVPDYMDEYIAIALLLMSEKVKGANSKWKPYIDVLPSVADVYPSFTWSPEELEMLRGSPSYFASLSLK